MAVAAVTDEALNKFVFVKKLRVLGTLGPLPILSRLFQFTESVFAKRFENINTISDCTDQ